MFTHPRIDVRVVTENDSPEIKELHFELVKEVKRRNSLESTIKKLTECVRASHEKEKALAAKINTIETGNSSKITEVTDAAFATDGRDDFRPEF